MKKSKIALVALSALLVTGCSKVQVELKNPNDPIVVDQNGAVVDVENNKIQQIFSTIQNGDYLTSAVKDMLTEGIYTAYLGKYNVDKDGNVYIEGVDLSSDSSVFSFIEEHSFYWNWEQTGSKVTFEEAPSMSNIQDYKDRLTSYIELVQKEVVKRLYSEATTSYLKNNKFYESLYCKNLYGSLYNIYNEDGSKADPVLLYSTPDYKSEENKEEFEAAGYTFGKLVTRDYDPDKDYRMIIEGDTQLLHLYHYVDYINIAVIPDIMSNLLTQSYIFNEQYQSIGRTQARHLNFIKISDNDSNKAEEMVREFIERNVLNATESSVSYEPLIEAWNGTHEELNGENSTLDPEVKNEAKALADTVFGEEVTTIDSQYSSYIDGKTGEDYPYYEGSLYGDIIEDYSRLTNNPLTNDTSLYDSFITIDGMSFTPEEGLAVKVQNLDTVSYVTNEWGTSGTFDLGDTSIVSKLFSYGLATEFEIAKDPATTYAVDGYYLKQFQVGGPSFLKKETYSSPIDSVIWEHEDAYYIIEVVDQVSLDTLALDAEATSEEKDTVENYAREIGYTVASNGTYTNDALLYYLKQSNINYYDQDVYDFFKSEFPDLFE